MRLIQFLLLGLLLSSCLTQRRCLERFPPSVFSDDSTHVKDSIITQTFTVTIPGEQSIIHDTIPCPELEYHSEKKKNHITARVTISKGKLDVECIADSLKRIIEAQTHQIEIYRTEKERVVEQPPCDHRATKWDKFATWWFAGSVLVIIIAGYLKLKP